MREGIYKIPLGDFTEVLDDEDDYLSWANVRNARLRLEGTCSSSDCSDYGKIGIATLDIAKYLVNIFGLDFKKTNFSFNSSKCWLKYVIDPIVSGIKMILYVYLLGCDANHLPMNAATTGPDNSLFAIDG